MTDVMSGGLPAALYAAVEDHPDVAVVFAGVDSDDETTVAELFGDAEVGAAQLVQRGLGPGEVVAVWAPDTRAGVVTLLSAILCGATVMPILEAAGHRDVARMLSDSGARTVLVVDGADGERVRAEIDSAASWLVAAVTVISVPLDTGRRAQVPRAPRRGPASFVDDADVALLVYTSGTTSAPKGVQHSHASILAEVATQPAVLGAQPDDAQLACLPAGHLAGVIGVLRAFLLGNRTVVMRRWDAHRAAALIERFRVTVTAGTPFHLAGLLDAVASDMGRLATLREFLVGAATVPVPLVERAEAVGVVTFRCYGSTEHPTISVGGADDPRDKRLCTDGRPTPGTEVRIVDVDGRDRPVGETGEIWVRGPDQFIGYRDGRLDAETFVDGWMRTGDIGSLDAEGFLTVSDRIKDVVIRGGETLSSREIEAAIITHPLIEDVSVVAAPDDRYGECVCAVVVPTQGAHIELDLVREHVRGQGLSRFKAPERLMIVDRLPRTALGKVVKAELRNRL